MDTTENAILVVAEGMGQMANANRHAEKATGEDIVTLIPISLALTMAYLNKLSDAHWKYFQAMEQITQNHPNEAAKAASLYGVYTTDSTEMSSGTQAMNNLIQATKGELTSLEEASPYRMMTAFNNFESSINNIILSE